MSRTLILMRHAEAEPQGGTPDIGEENGDHERALTARGRGDARAAGVWLADTGLSVDVAVVSTALRARQTLDQVASRLDVTEKLSIATAYLAATDQLLAIVQQLPGQLRTAMLVGHAPGIGELAALLDDGQGDAALRWQVSAGLPTAGIVVLGVPSSWHELDARGATLLEITAGRQ